MRVFTTDHFEVPLPPEHRFPMSKYRLLRERLLAEGILTAGELQRAPTAPLERICAVHDAGYVRAFVAGTLDRSAVRRIGFPWSPELVARCLGSAGGTLCAVDAALTDGFAGVLAGGTHHAYRDFGSGYCVFNDLVVAARALLDDGRVRSVLVVDLDVHQGDGTAALCADEPRIFTLSLHGARNFPSRKQTSDLDVPLPDDTGDEAYLAALAPALEEALERSEPDFVIYQGGVDPLAEDRLGRLALSGPGLAARDRAVFEACAGAALPVAATLGGGYCQPIEPTLDAHVATYRIAREVFFAPAGGPRSGPGAG